MRVISLKPNLENTNEVDNKVIFRKTVGRNSIYPGESDKADFSVTMFHNIDPRIVIYAKYSSGYVSPIRFMDIDSNDRGVYIMEKHNYLPMDNASLEIIRLHMRNSKEFLHRYDRVDNGLDSVITKMTNAEHKGVMLDTIDELNGSMDDYDISLREYLNTCNTIRNYKYIDRAEFNDDNHIMIDDYNIMLSLNDHVTPYPEKLNIDKVNSGVSIMIHNSKNPTKVYYSKILGKIQPIPVKNDNKHQDGVIITNCVSGVDIVETFELEDLTSLSIYENREDAAANGDSELQLKIQELEMKSKSISNKDKESTIKLEIEQLKKAFEKEKMEFEREKAGLEAARLQQEKESEIEKAKQDKELAELKKRVEEVKAVSSERKAKYDNTGSIWKMIGGIVAGIVTVIGVVWKLFF